MNFKKHLTQYLNTPAFWVLLSFAGLLAADWQALTDLYRSWQTEEYSHGIVIPFLSLLLACHLLAKHKPQIKPSWLGLGTIVVAGFLMLVSALSAFTAAAQYGLIVGILAITLACLGRTATVVIIPALAYLIFAIPLPHLVQATLSQDLQLLSSSIGVWILDLFGLSVFQEGNVIDLAGYRLQVVEACSGLRYLFPLMSFGYLIAFLLEDRMWKRLVLFLSTIPITIGMNALRIAFIGFTVDMWGGKMAEGFIHDFEGWTIFLFCTAILLVEVWLLRFVGSKGRFKYEYFTLPRWPIISGDLDSKRPPAAVFGSIVILIVLFGLESFANRPEIIPAHPPMYSFNLQLGDWQGKQDRIDPDVLRALQLSDYWIANYRRADDTQPVNLYIAYYASQRVGVTTHSPANCIPGGGWLVKSKKVENLDVGNGQSVKATRLLIRRDEDAQLVYYWFDERGRNMTETYATKWYLLLDSITMNRTDGALIRLVTPIPKGESEEKAENRMQAFLTTAYPEIKTYIPGRFIGNNIAIKP